MAVNQSLEDLISTSNQTKTIIRQKSLFLKFIFKILISFYLLKIATDLDDYTDLSRILEEYDSDNKQIRQGCYYFIDQTQLFRVKNVLSYLEANRQVIDFHYF